MGASLSDAQQRLCRGDGASPRNPRPGISARGVFLLTPLRSPVGNTTAGAFHHCLHSLKSLVLIYFDSQVDVDFSNSSLYTGTLTQPKQCILFLGTNNALLSSNRKSKFCLVHACGILIKWVTGEKNLCMIS